MKGHASLWYENLKKNRVREVKSKTKILFNLKKHMEKRFLPASYEEELYLKITSLSQENVKAKYYSRELNKFR